MKEQPESEIETEKREKAVKPMTDEEAGQAVGGRGRPPGEGQSWLARQEEQRQIDAQLNSRFESGR